MGIHWCIVPADVLAKYNITPDYFDSKGFEYFEICNGMYVLYGVSISALYQLNDHLATYCHVPCNQNLAYSATKLILSHLL